MHIDTATENDITCIEDLICYTVESCIGESGLTEQFLIDEILKSLEWWQKNPSLAIHKVARKEGKVIGVILLKECTRLMNLFVHPDHQRQGVGTQLVNSVLDDCRFFAPGGSLSLNSSHAGESFYRSFGFEQSGEIQDLPGGCIPFKLCF